MISVVHNQVLNSIDICLDDAGAKLLIKTLQALKGTDHLHLYATNNDDGVCTKSPYNEEVVFGELILQMLPSDVWDDLK